MRVREVPDGGFSSGSPYWYWLGGRPSLDLVNTRRERWNRNVETLVDDADVVRWLVAARLLPGAMRPPRGLVEEARALRESIDAAVLAIVEGVAPPAEALTTVDDWLVHAGSRPALVAGDDGQPLLGERAAADSPRRALGMVALDAARMIGSAEERARMRICAADDCSARFFDRSPAGRRRWCSMKECGNVAKARRHRARAESA